MCDRGIYASQQQYLCIILTCDGIKDEKRFYMQDLRMYLLQRCRQAAVSSATSTYNPEDNKMQTVHRTILIYTEQL